MSNFWKSVLSSKDPTSSKRLITLIVAAIFILTCITALFFAFYLVLYITKGKVEPELFSLLKQILEYEFFIVVSGFGFISADNFGQVLVERAKILTLSKDKIDEQVKEEGPIEPEPPK